MKDSAGFWADMKLSSAVWEYSGNPKSPHVQLQNGNCSDGFIDCLQYLSSTANLIFAADAMVAKLVAKLGGRRVDWGVGSPMAAIPFSTLIGVKMGIPRVGFTEKGGNNNKDQLCRFDMPQGTIFLNTEEMTTSGKTPQRLNEAIIRKNPGVESLPFIGAFLIRCERRPAALHGKEIVPLIDLPKLGVFYHEWEDGTCPHCAAGSRAVTNVKKVWVDFLKTMTDPAHDIPGAEYKERA